MTTINGTFTSCGGGEWFSLAFTCDGRYCKDFEDFPNVTCSPMHTGISCKNGVKCPGHTNWTSTFSLRQPAFRVFETSDLYFADWHQHFRLISDGTKDGTSVQQMEFKERSAKSCEDNFWTSVGITEYTFPNQPSNNLTDKTIEVRSGSATKHPVLSIPALLCSLMLLLNFILACTASATFGPELEKTHLIRRTAKEPSLEQLSRGSREVINFFAENLAAKTKQGIHHPEKSYFAESVLAEFEAYACEHLLTKLIHAWDTIRPEESPILWSENCHRFMMENYARTAEDRLQGYFLFKLFCDITYNEVMRETLIHPMEVVCEDVHDLLAVLHTPGFHKEGSLDEKEQEMRQFVLTDTTSDPENCGDYGKRCSSGVCINGACTSPTCIGQDSLIGPTSCSSTSSCFCAEDQEGNGFCVLDTDGACTTIGATADSCNLHNPCPPGYVCTTSPKCGAKMCLDARQCGAGAAVKPASKPSKYPSPGDTIPLAGRPLSGWTFRIDSPTSPSSWSNDHSLQKSQYLNIDGELTVNTKCLKVKDMVPSNSLPGDGTIIPAGSEFGFETKEGNDPDTCCLYLFENDRCDTHGGPGQRTCEFVSSGLTLFDTRSWEVYNCRGLYDESIG
ncbi:hypothetical protein QSH57_004201 [Fusarium oxysporum f. sp. vasinfectum]|nr:hypothetical protein QSH57_004201 [Fusarium oxysporum f. sp. vasinfectum]